MHGAGCGCGCPARPGPPSASSPQLPPAEVCVAVGRKDGEAFGGGGVSFTALHVSFVLGGPPPGGGLPQQQPPETQQRARHSPEPRSMETRRFPKETGGGPDGISFSAGDRMACKALAHPDTPPTVVRTVLIQARHPTLRCANDAAPTATARRRCCRPRRRRPGSGPGAEPGAGRWRQPGGACGPGACGPRSRWRGRRGRRRGSGAGKRWRGRAGAARGRGGRRYAEAGWLVVCVPKGASRTAWACPA